LCALNPPLTTLSREGTKAHKQKYDLLVRFEASKPKRDLAGRPQAPQNLALQREGQAKEALAHRHPRRPQPSNVRLLPGLRGPFLPKDGSRPEACKGEPEWPVCGIPERFYTDHGPDFESNSNNPLTLCNPRSTPTLAPSMCSRTSENSLHANFAEFLFHVVRE
jgi:putative transposase